MDGRLGVYRSNRCLQDRRKLIENCGDLRLQCHDFSLDERLVSSHSPVQEVKPLISPRMVILHHYGNNNHTTPHGCFAAISKLPPKTAHHYACPRGLDPKMG